MAILIILGVLLITAVDVSSKECEKENEKRFLFDDDDFSLSKVVSYVKEGMCHRDSDCSEHQAGCPAYCIYNCFGHYICHQEAFHGQYTGEHGFYYADKADSFKHALSICKHKKLRLVQIDSNAKLKLVQSFVSSHKGHTSSAHFHGYWIDKVRSGNHDKYLHSDGSDSPFLLHGHHHFENGGTCIDLDVCTRLMKQVECKDDSFESGVICEEECNSHADCVSEHISCPSQNKHCIDNTCQCKDIQVQKNDTTGTSSSSECWKHADCHGKVECQNNTRLHCIDGKCTCQFIPQMDRSTTTPNPTTTQDICITKPCVHGFYLEAIYSDQGYICLCDNGYKGYNCDINIDECSVSPCHNDGTCKDQVNGYSCTCPQGFTGQTCDIVLQSTATPTIKTTVQELNECEAAPCQNGASCVDRYKSYYCHCQPGYTGHNCEEDINECISAPCQNDGTCMDEKNRFSCRCKKGFKGPFCETDVDECEKSPCQNGATCIDEINAFYCECPDGFTGQYCETNIDECILTPCRNGAICEDGINNFICHCKPGFTGRTCEIALCVSDYDCTTNNTVAHGPFGDLPCVRDAMRICRQGRCSCNATAASTPLTTTRTTSDATVTTTSTTPSFGHSCYQCGDIASKIPCSVQFVYQGTPSPCLHGKYCQTDIYEDTYGNKEIYKRCVSEQTCLHEWLQQSSDKEYCVRYGRVKTNEAFLCSFCCVGKDCNNGLIPRNGTLYGSSMD